CKAIAIYAQAVLAGFTNNGNELSHLEEGLEAETISKLVQRISTVKGVAQPFSSFGGVPLESDAKYYRRVSERLRHKNRTITLWDYEHIILQQFSGIHKVKCLNHTSETSFLAPGDVLVIVIPDIINKNVFDIYQPRVSKALLNEVQDYINKLNSFHVNAVVRNPDYEEVTVNLKVKFYDGFDESFYKKQLNEDITRLLSPWAFERSAEIRFGVTLHRSTVINYIEKLGYVDYVADVKLQKGGETNTKSVSPESPKAILVSAKQHQISTDIKSCTTKIETEETCQS
ncbi:baseplate J/gp47 family protein, partial [Mariniphaga sediminis]|uniref:baseplate J/gp47 family protein n=1 Tax=Mariniphaga sediminis TaxID=1628158 RepID=UPI003567FDF3